MLTMLTLGSFPGGIGVSSEIAADRLWYERFRIRLPERVIVSRAVL